MSNELESVKLDKAVLALVRENKKKTHIPIGKFIEELILKEFANRKRDGK